MPEIIDIQEPKHTLSRLVERALAGEEIVLAQAGQPLVKLVPVTRCRTPRQPGKWRGKVWMADHFDQLPDGILDDFEAKTR
jgi:antitoxin (DNA-binding transcriptional repressor) of toxin-antitoxin stability system